MVTEKGHQVYQDMKMYESQRYCVSKKELNFKITLK